MVPGVWVGVWGVQPTYGENPPFTVDTTPGLPIDDERIEDFQSVVAGWCGCTQERSMLNGGFSPYVGSTPKRAGERRRPR